MTDLYITAAFYEIKIHSIYIQQTVWPLAELGWKLVVIRMEGPQGLTTQRAGPKHHVNPHGTRSTHTFMTAAQTTVCHIAVTHDTLLTVWSFMI